MAKHKEHIFNLTNWKYASEATLLVILISILTIVLLQHNYYNETYGEKDLVKFEQVLHNKEGEIKKIFRELSKEFKVAEPMDVLEEKSEKLKALAGQQDMFVYYFDNGRLKYWSDHSVSMRFRWSSRMNTPLFQTRNSLYVTVHQPVEEGMLFGLILIRTEYPYENDYLENGYQQRFRMSPELELSRNPQTGFSDVQSQEGTYLFSLDFKNTLKKNEQNVTLSVIIFILALIALFFFFGLKTDYSDSAGKRSVWLMAGTFLILVISSGALYFRKPKIIFESDFFKPDIYASLNFSSLGHLWVFVMMILMVIMLIYWFLNRSGAMPDKLRLPVSIFFITVAALWFVFAHHLGKSLVLDSSISFEAYKLNTLSEYTFIGLFILVMTLMVFTMLIDKAISLFKTPLRKRDYLWIFLTGAVVQTPFLMIQRVDLEILTMLFSLGVVGSLVYLRSGRAKLKFSRFFTLIFLVAIFITIDLQEHTSEKLSSQKEIELAKLSSEHDAVAEMIFTELTDQLLTDSMLISRLRYQIIDADLIYEYLERVYFSGYMVKYDLQITLCRDNDSVYIEPPNEGWYPCYSFFDEKVYEEGISISGSRFYFLNNLNGRISYLGVIPYDLGDDQITLFLELDTKIISEELGYPMLLMKESQEKGTLFSYAKYNRGKLITSKGDYNYRLTSDFYTRNQQTFEELEAGGYEHSIFNMDPENTVIVSLPVVKFVDKLISFSYNFAFLFILFSLTYLLVSISHIRATVTWDFKNKIQYSVIGILFLTFLVICSGTIYFVIQQYRIKHQDNLQNTMRSLYIELVHKVEFEEDLRNWSSDGYYNLDELLKKFSNVFYTDINMYDESGLLLATSRSEIFDQQLLSVRMNREAYDKLANENYSAFIHTEKIGKMSYQSAYLPLLNSENNFLAYMNLPYFTQPEMLTQEVTNLVVVILNTYVILLLLILFLTVFLADRITQPLRFIQSRIAQLSLSKNNEKIVYKGKDEIAGLVDEYNYMVEELMKSAKLLAQSERESAWREMAKQIAHEIKNPLTPMKLSVQHMQRMIMEEGENIAERVERVSQTLIEQIDSLTSIANEFSDFAKMPRARNRKINLVIKLRNVVNLFENSKGFFVDLDLKGHTEVMAFGDPEQFQRVIINLVKNGMQSVPEEREKKMAISMEMETAQFALIKVSDNGKGIPESVQDKLFQPNFTTKSSGMGMGLAITANIVKSMGGSIWFETESGKGTTFFVKIPVVNT
ncbi:MAG: ATP-binding protein [Bacteroidales bacterium]